MQRQLNNLPLEYRINFRVCAHLHILNIKYCSNHAPKDIPQHSEVRSYLTHNITREKIVHIIKQRL